MKGPRLTYVVATGVLFAPAIAAAHIHLLTPLSHTDDATGDPQKTEHCGETPPWTRDSARVQMFAPGATITVTWKETVEHPGWYRIAFLQDGLVFPIPPASDGPADGGIASNYPTEDLTGMVEPTTGAYVLADRIVDQVNPGAQTDYSMDVTLPNVTCENCALQLIQMMTQTATYEPADDIYFQCSDIRLSANAPDAAPATTPDADPGNPDTGDDDDGGSSGATGGCSTGGGSSGIFVALGLAALFVRRRR